VELPAPVLAPALLALAPELVAPPAVLALVLVAELLAPELVALVLVAELLAPELVALVLVAELLALVLPPALVALVPPAPPTPAAWRWSPPLVEQPTPAASAAPKAIRIARRSITTMLPRQGNITGYPRLLAPAHLRRRSLCWQPGRQRPTDLQEESK
jgi:hypothetical protein